MADPLGTTGPLARRAAVPSHPFPFALPVVMARKMPKKSGMLIKSPAGIVFLVLLLLRVLAQLFKWRRGG